MKTKMVDINKNGKGHDVFVDGEFVFWVIGSKKNARTELEKHLKKIN